MNQDKKGYSYNSDKWDWTLIHFHMSPSSDYKQMPKIDIFSTMAAILVLTWVPYFSERTGYGEQVHQIWCLYHQVKE